MCIVCMNCTRFKVQTQLVPNLSANETGNDSEVSAGTADVNQSETRTDEPAEYEDHSVAKAETKQTGQDSSRDEPQPKRYFGRFA